VGLVRGRNETADWKQVTARRKRAASGQRTADFARILCFAHQGTLNQLADHPVSSNAPLVSAQLEHASIARSDFVECSLVSWTSDLPPDLPPNGGKAWVTQAQRSAGDCHI